MRHLVRLGAAALALLTAADARAQFYAGGAPAPAGGNQAFARGLAAGPDQGKNVSSFSYNPYAPFGSAGNIATPWSTQYGSWIQPAASYWAQDDIARQQATTQKYFQKQDYELRRLQLKRASFDEMMYEKMHTPPPEVEREALRQNRLMRARSTPPLEEIASGQALNELLTNLQRTSSVMKLNTPSSPIDPETLKHLNVTTTGDSRGSNEMFRPGGLPEWPQAFEDTAFAAGKTSVQREVNALAKARGAGQPVGDLTTRSRRALASLKDTLYQNRFKVSFRDYADALEFLSKMENAVEALAKPASKNFLDGTYSAKGNTIAELVDYMVAKGLQFAMATKGDEPYYSQIYQQLVSYELAVSRQVGMMHGPALTGPTPKTP